MEMEKNQSIFGSNPCPHCSVTVFLTSEFKGLANDIDGNWLVHYALCPNCRRLVIELSRAPRYHDGVEVSERLVTLAHPKVIQRDPPPPEVPEEFTKDYLEAALIVRDSPKASAALSRRLLQHLLREKADADQRNLFDAIQHVVDQGNLPSHIAESLHTLRELGNFAAHPNKSTNTAEVIEVEHGEAEWCLDVIDALYDHYFVSPAKTQRAKDAINDKRNEAGLQSI